MDLSAACAVTAGTQVGLCDANILPRDWTGVLTREVGIGQVLAFSQGKIRTQPLQVTECGEVIVKRLSDH